MVLTAILLALNVGALVYSLLSVIAARRYRAAKPPALTSEAPISVLKPLAGAEDDLYENLRSFFLQRYSEFEILFAVRQASDPAIPVVRRLQSEFTRVASHLIVTGEPPYPNAKVFSLDHMKRAARYEILAMSDSDIRVTPDFLRAVAAEFQDEKLGLSTCPYRAVPGRSLPSRLEAIGMNTQFLGGVLTARMLEGMKFALGPTIIARKNVLDAIGGFDRLKVYLAEDFVMGNFAAQAGYGVILSSYVIEHHIGGHPFWSNLAHRIRWVRSTRRSRPKGYVGEIFTNPLPLALFLLAWQPQMWWIAAVACAVRAWSAWEISQGVLKDPLVRRNWHWLAVQDLLAFLIWLAGFFGNTILWRGRKYYLHSDGRFELI